MKKATPAHKNWHNLYELASKAYEVGAWDWIYEDQIFGLRIPYSPHTWYVSIMGVSGEHLCYCFYRGEQGLASYIDMRNKMIAIDESNMELLQYHHLQFMRSQDCIQVSFEEKEMMDETQLAHLERIGIQYGEDDLWSSIVDWTPSLAPWPIGEDQVRLAHDLLEKTIAIALEVETNPEGLHSWDGYGNMMPIYTSTAAPDGTLTWDMAKEVVDTPRKTAQAYEPLYPNGWSQLKNTPKKGLQLAAGRMMTLQGVQPSEDLRPYYIDPILLLSVKTGEIIGMAMGSEETTDLESQILQIIMDLGSCPKSVSVADQLSLGLLQPCLELAGIECALEAGATQALAMVTAQLGEMMDNM